MSYKTASHQVTSDVKISSKIQNEHNKPLSQIKVLCEKENQFPLTATVN